MPLLAVNSPMCQLCSPPGWPRSCAHDPQLRSCRGESQEGAMHRSHVGARGRLSTAARSLAAAAALGCLTLAIHVPAQAAPLAAGGMAAAGVDGVAAGNAAIASVDLS